MEVRNEAGKTLYFDLDRFDLKNFMYARPNFSAFIDQYVEKQKDIVSYYPPFENWLFLTIRYRFYLKSLEVCTIRSIASIFFQRTCRGITSAECQV